MHYLILHGIQGHAGENWGQWVYDSLTADGYEVAMPSLPDPGHPVRTEWLSTITAVAGVKTKDTVIIAHSLGVTSALDFIENHRVLGLVSVSGFADDYGLPLNSYFLQEKRIDYQRVLKHTAQSFVLYGDNDPYVPQKILRALAYELQVDPIIVPAGGHLNAAAGFERFPLLLETVRKIQP